MKAKIDIPKEVPAWFGRARKYAQHVASHDMPAIRQSIEKGRVAEMPCLIHAAYEQLSVDEMLSFERAACRLANVRVLTVE